LQSEVVNINLSDVLLHAWPKTYLSQETETA
jgi:hypothetical protein